MYMLSSFRHSHVIQNLHLFLWNTKKYILKNFHIAVDLVGNPLLAKVTLNLVTCHFCKK